VKAEAHAERTLSTAVEVELPSDFFNGLLGEGEVLGWSWLLPPYQWHYSARAIEPTQVIALDGAELRTRCEQDHDLGYEIMKRFALVIVQRLEATRARFLSFPDPGPASESSGHPGFPILGE
jgi:CRP-like cAMP-binding protein